MLMCESELVIDSVGLAFDLHFLQFLRTCRSKEQNRKSFSFHPLGTRSSASSSLPSHLCLLPSCFSSLPCSSNLPSDLLLSLSQRAESQPDNCMSAGHHTCCCHCSCVLGWGCGAALWPLQLQLSPPPPLPQV